MLEAPSIVTTAPLLTAVIRLRIPRDEIRHVMGPGIGEIMATLTAQSIPPAAPWFTRHFKMEPGVFDFEIAVPVSRPITPSGRVTNGDLPAARVGRAVLHGGYEGLAGAWPLLDAWIVAQGHTPAPSLIETYLVSPATTPDPSAWRTELSRPLVP